MFFHLAVIVMVLLSSPAQAAVEVPGATGRAPLDLIVKYQAIAPATVADVQAEIGVEVLEVAELDESTPGLRTLKFRSERDLDAAMAKLEADPTVEYVERASGVTAQQDVLLVPNDPRYPAQWDKHIQGAEEAWDAETGGPSVLIVISDTAGRCSANPDLTNCRQDLSIDFLPLDPAENFHGYHVAGTAAATIGNGVHIAGTAGTAQIALARFLNASGSGNTADGLRTINHAIALQQSNPNRRVVLNMSWGHQSTTPEQSTQDALNRFAEVGGIAVAAAGNNNANNCGATKFWPASYANVIAVASTDQSDAKSSFSNFGSCAKASGGVLIAAPGGAPGILSLDNTPAGTRTAQGTSMASPQVAGAVALVLSQNPGLGVGEIIDRLMANSVPVSVPVISGGRLSLPGILEAPQPGVRLSIACPIPTEVNRGSRLNCAVTTRAVGGFGGPVALSCSGIRCAVAPTTVTVGAGATLAVTPGPTAPLGLRTVTVRGVASVGTATASVGVVVDPVGTRRLLFTSTEDAAFGKPCFSCAPVRAETSIVVPDNLRLLDLTGTAHIVWTLFGSDLRVALINPAGTVQPIPIPFGTPGSALLNLPLSTDRFDGSGTGGEWTLRVDYAGLLSRMGRIDGWELRLKAAPLSSGAGF